MPMTASQVSVSNSDTTLFTATAAGATHILVAATLLNDQHPLLISVYRSGAVVNNAILTSNSTFDSNLQQNDEVHTINLYGYVLVDVISAS